MGCIFSKPMKKLKKQADKMGDFESISSLSIPSDLGEADFADMDADQPDNNMMMDMDDGM